MNEKRFELHRRKFLAALAGGGAYALFPASFRSSFSKAASKSLRILMLGGTSFVGPHLVRTAAARGHKVTLFNRGITNPHLFQDLEKLRGNRYEERGQGLSELAGSRSWDAVLDTWQEAPACVARTAELLNGRIRRYLYISSIATYRNYRQAGMTEDGPLLDASEHIDSLDPELGYSERKRASEQAVHQVFGGGSTILRCTSIQGFNESPDAERDAGYWGYRFLTGKPVLAPDDADAPFQLIDVKDMANFAIQAIEREWEGAYNMVGPERPLLLRDYIAAWSDLSDRRSQIVWAEPSWLLDQGIRPFSDIRNWIPIHVPEPGFYQISNEKAKALGLQHRPLQATIRDAIASVGDVAKLEPPTVGMSSERELELIEAWRAAAG